MIDYVIGADGGGTRTRVVLLDPDGLELGRREGPGSLVDPAEPERSAAVIARAIEECVDAAGLSLPACVLWAGIAGAGRETVRRGVELSLERMSLAQRVIVGTDVEAGFQDAFEGGPGILLVSGTGSIAWGRAEDGREARVGGWGTLLGDEGSGYAIGLEALRRVARNADGRAPGTDLRDRILDFLQLDHVEDLIPWSAAASKDQLAALVPTVVDASRSGDAVAGEILVKAAEELEGHVLTLLDNLGPWRKSPTLALAGGLLDPGRPLRGAMERLAAQHRLSVIHRPLDAARGAVWKARAELARMGGLRGADRP